MSFGIVRFGKFLEFFKLEIFGIFGIANYLHLSNRKFFEFSKLKIFHIANFLNIPNWKFLEVSKLKIVEIFQIDNFRNLQIGNSCNFPK